jgi:hypothetical protein
MGIERQGDTRSQSDFDVINVATVDIRIQNSSTSKSCAYKTRNMGNMQLSAPRFSPFQLQIFFQEVACVVVREVGPA